jgi:hypothetical protein
MQYEESGEGKPVPGGVEGALVWTLLLNISYSL